VVQSFTSLVGKQGVTSTIEEEGTRSEVAQDQEQACFGAFVYWRLVNEGVGVCDC
jgi:hypothetical protein